MDIPWQLCWTVGPLLSQRFPLASAKAQPRGDFDAQFSFGNGVDLHFNNPWVRSVFIV